jgi:hypothetical protein
MKAGRGSCSESEVERIEELSIFYSMSSFACSGRSPLIAFYQHIAYVCFTLVYVINAFIAFLCSLRKCHMLLNHAHWSVCVMCLLLYKIVRCILFIYYSFIDLVVCPEYTAYSGERFLTKFCFNIFLLTFQWAWCSWMNKTHLWFSWIPSISGCHYLEWDIRGKNNVMF